MSWGKGGWSVCVKDFVYKLHLCLLLLNVMFINNSDSVTRVNNLGRLQIT